MPCPCPARCGAPNQVEATGTQGHEGRAAGRQFSGQGEGEASEAVLRRRSSAAAAVPVRAALRATPAGRWVRELAKLYEVPNSTWERQAEAGKASLPLILPPPSAPCPRSTATTAAAAAVRTSMPATGLCLVPLQREEAQSRAWPPLAPAVRADLRRSLSVARAEVGHWGVSEALQVLLLLCILAGAASPLWAPGLGALAKTNPICC